MQRERLRDIFVSHSHADMDAVKDIAALWERWGYDVGADFRDEKLVNASRGKVMSPELADHLRGMIFRCKVFVFVVSENSAKSGWMPWELGLAHGAIGRVHLYLLEPNALEAFDEEKREYLRLYERHTFSAANSTEYLQQVVDQARFEAFSPAQLQASADLMRETAARVRGLNPSELGRFLSVGAGQSSTVSERVSTEQSIEAFPHLKAALQAAQQMQEAFREAIDVAGLREAATGGRKRRVTRGGSKRPIVAKPLQIDCHFLAEMDSEVVVDQTTSVDVTIAREALTPTQGREAHVKTTTVEKGKKLIVQIAERRNFRVEGDRRVEIKVPEPGEPAEVHFDVVGLVADSDGELWVQVRQGPIPLVTLKLQPRIVAQRGVSTTSRMEATGSVAEFPPAQKPMDEMLIEESFVGDAVRYRFYVNLPSLKIRKSYDSQPLPGARDDYIKQLLNEIGDSWAGEGKEGLVAFERGLKAIGGKMFDQLIPREMQQLLWDNRDRIRTVQVFSMEPFIPWELVYLKNPAERVAPKDSKFLGELGLVRWLYEGFPPSSLKIGRERAVYVIPDYPPGLELPEAADEAKMLKRIFKDAKGIPAQLNTIETLLETPGAFDLLHFGGHGEAAGTESSHARLLIDGQLEDGKFVGDALSATTVEQTAQLKTDVNQPIVVLNACESARRNREFAGMGGFADAFVKAGAGVFVGTHWSVGDAPARTFIEAFYQSFTAPKKKAIWLSDAVTEARQAARNAGDATWLAYVVYGHPRCTVERTA